MADGVTYQTSVAATPPDGLVVATDDAGAPGHVQLFKLAYSANGSATLVPADADGLLVNLGANNDVAVSGTVTANHAITGIGDGRKTVASAGSAEALASSTTCKRVVIVAETDNTGTVVVGASTVVAALGTRRGVPLGPGDVFELEIDNLADVFLDVTVAGDGVTYAYFT